jgi:hypothetical protein
LNAPENVLGGIAAEAEVSRMEGCEMFLPSLFAGGLPALGDGIAEKEDVDSAFACFVQFCRVSCGPPTKLAGVRA